MSIISTPLYSLASKECNKHFYSSYGVLPKAGVAVAVLGVSGYIAVKYMHCVSETMYESDAVKSLCNLMERKDTEVAQETEMSINMSIKDAKDEYAESNGMEIWSGRMQQKEFKVKKEDHVIQSQEETIRNSCSQWQLLTCKQNIFNFLNCTVIKQLLNWKHLVTKAPKAVFLTLTKCFTCDELVCAAEAAESDDDDELFALSKSSPIFYNRNTTVKATTQTENSHNKPEVENVNEEKNSKNSLSMNSERSNREVINSSVTIDDNKRNHISDNNRSFDRDDTQSNRLLVNLKNKVNIDVNVDCNVLIASELNHNQITESTANSNCTKELNWPSNIVTRTKALGMVHALIRKIRTINLRKESAENGKIDEKNNSNLIKSNNDDDNEDFDDDDYVDDEEVTNSDTTDVSLNYHIASSMERETYDELVELLNERKADSCELFQLREDNNNSALLEMLTKVAEYLDISNEREKLRERRAYLHFSDHEELTNTDEHELTKHSLTSKSEEIEETTEKANEILDQVQMIDYTSHYNVAKRYVNDSNKKSSDENHCVNEGAKWHFDDVKSHKDVKENRTHDGKKKNSKFSNAGTNDFEEVADSVITNTGTKSNADCYSKYDNEEPNKLNVLSSSWPINTVLEEKLKKNELLKNRQYTKKENLDTELFEHGWGPQNRYNRGELESNEHYLASHDNDDDDDDADFMTYLEQNDAAEYFYNRDEIRLRRRDPVNRMRIISEHANLFEGIADAHVSKTSMDTNKYFTSDKDDVISIADDYDYYFNSESNSRTYNNYLNHLLRESEKSQSHNKPDEITNASANQEVLSRHELRHNGYTALDEISYLKENNSNFDNNNDDDNNKKIINKKHTPTRQREVKKENHLFNQKNLTELLMENKNVGPIEGERYAEYGEKRKSSNEAAETILNEIHENDDRAADDKIGNNLKNFDSASKYNRSNEDIDYYNNYEDKMEFDNNVNEYSNFSRHINLIRERIKTENEEELEEEWESLQEEKEHLEELHEEEEYEKYWPEELEEEWLEEEEEEEELEEEYLEEEQIEEEYWPLEQKLSFEEELIERIYNLAHQLKVSEAMGQKELNAADAAREKRHAAVKTKNEIKKMESSNKIAEKENCEEKELSLKRWQNYNVTNERDGNYDDCDEWEDASSIDL